MPLLDFLNFYLVPGIVLGSIYAVGAIGITLVFGILRFAHFAHGDMATLGAFIALALVAGGMDPWTALPVAMAATAVVAIGVDKAFYDYLKARPKIVTVMASLGVALMLDPKLLLLDEPTAGLSPKYMEQIFQITRDVRDAGVSILLVEQHAKQALAFCDRGYVLATGANRHEGTGQALLADREVAEMFLGG